MAFGDPFTTAPAAVVKGSPKTSCKVLNSVNVFIEVQERRKVYLVLRQARQKQSMKITSGRIENPDLMSYSVKK